MVFGYFACRGVERLLRIIRDQQMPTALTPQGVEQRDDDDFNPADASSESDEDAPRR